MKKQLLSLAATLAVASAGYAAVSTDQFNEGEILIGFWTSSGTGAGTNMVVNLGSFGSFDDRDGTSFSVSRLSVADLSATYGATWNSRTDLFWAVAGGIGSTVGGVGGVSPNTLFTVSPRVNIANAPTSITAQTYSTQSSDYTDIATAGTGYNNGDTAGFSNTFTVGLAMSGTSLYKSQTTTPTARFGTAQNNDTTGTNISDLYALVPASGIGSEDPVAAGYTRGTNYLGYFTLDASGLSYTATSAIPEPSTYAALGGLAALGFAMVRRRRNNQA